MEKKIVYGSRTAIGSMTQLAAVGPQDINIHYDENTQGFLFQASYNQHTRFGIDINSVYDVRPSFGSIFRFSIPFEKQHLISDITLKVDLPQISEHSPDTSSGLVYKNKLGYRLIKNVYIEHCSHQY